MDVGHEHDGLFSLIDTYNEGLAFFKGGDAYPYASGFSDAAEAMGFRIAWNREQDKSLQIESVICEKHGVGMTKDGDLILSAFRARLIDVGGRFGKGHSYIYGAWTGEEFSRVVEWLTYRLDRLGYDWRPHPMYRGRNFREPEDR